MKCPNIKIDIQFITQETFNQIGMVYQGKILEARKRKKCFHSKYSSFLTSGIFNGMSRHFGESLFFWHQCWPRCWWRRLELVLVVRISSWRLLCTTLCRHTYGAEIKVSAIKWIINRLNKNNPNSDWEMLL